MKKSVVLIIIAVYILSVCVVGFFGIKLRLYNETVNPESLEITKVTLDDSELKINVDNHGVKNAFSVCDADSTVTFKIYYDLLPANTTDKSILLEYTQNAGYEVVQAPGENAVYITFALEDVPVSCKLTVKSKLFPQIKDTILITAVVA